MYYRQDVAKKDAETSMDVEIPLITPSLLKDSYEHQTFDSDNDHWNPQDNAENSPSFDRIEESKISEESNIDEKYTEISKVSCVEMANDYVAQD